jgi:hypothetical protein
MDTDIQLPDTKPGPYFVSVADAGRVALLAGPYDTHAEALAKVDHAQTLAEERDSRAVFYGFGTVRMQPGTHSTIFGIL